MASSLAVPNPEASLMSLARNQQGAFTRLQALDAGLTKHQIDLRLERGRWEPIFRGVFRLAGDPPTLHQTLAAACLAIGPQAAASHHSAAYLWNLPVEQTRPQIEITVPRTVSGRLPNVIVHKTRQLRQQDLGKLFDVPVTSIGRTLIDLAGTLPSEKLEECLDDVLNRRLLSVPRMKWLLRQNLQMGRRGTGSLWSLLEGRTSTPKLPESVLGTRMRRVLKASNLPAFEAQYRVPLPNGKSAFVDFAYPATEVALEVDGYRFHSGRVAWDKDRTRRNLLTQSGWLVLHFTSTDLAGDPRVIVSVIHKVLLSREPNTGNT